MTIDLSSPFTTSLQGSHKSWPKCGPCSARLKYWYPVEVFGFVGKEHLGELHGRYKLILEAECHGDKRTFALPIPDWYPDGKVLELCSKTILFRRGPDVQFRDLVGMTWTGR